MTNHKSYYQKLLAVFLLTIIMVSFPRSLFAAESTYKWSKRLGNTNSDYPKSLDSYGENIALVFYTNGDSDINGDGDKTDGGAESATGYGNNDVILSVFNLTGTHQWAKRLGSSANDNNAIVKIDRSTGNIVVIARFSGDTDINGDGDKTDNGESSTGYGSSDILITVFNSAGTHQWSKRFGSVQSDTLKDVVIDSNGVITIFGETPSTPADMDLNGDGDNTDGGAESITGYGNADIFLTAFNSSGTHQWAKRIGNAGSDSGQHLEIGPNNNVVVSAVLNSSAADLNGDGDSSDTGENGTGTGIVSVFNSSGTHQWAERIGISSGLGIGIDSNNNIAIGGIRVGAADLNGDDDTTDGEGESATGYGSNDYLITVFNSAGTYQWSKRLGSTDAESSNYYPVKFDTNNNLIVTFSNTGLATDLNGDADSTDGGAETTATGRTFISAFNSSGTYQWSKRFGSSGVSSITTFIDHNNNVISGGYTTAATDLNGDGDVTDTSEAHGSPGYADIFFTVTNSSGTHQWARRIGGDVDDYADTPSSFVTDSGHMVLAGYVDGAADLNGDGDRTDSGEDTPIQYEDVTLTFWSDDVSAPSTSSITAAAAADVTVTWTTDEASSSIVEYGTTTSYGTTTTEADTSPRVTSHSVTLTGLTTCTTYHYRVKSTDAEGNTTTGSDIEFKTGGCPAQQAAPGDDTPQVSLGSSGSNASSGALSPIRDSNTQGQKVSVILEPNTLTMNAFLSSQASIPSSGNSLFVNPITGQSILNKNANMVFAGNILGIRSGSCISWQVGRVQKMWFKAYPPKGSSSAPAAIIPELQLKSSIISLGYNDLDLIPPGNKANSFREGSLKLAHSLDGSNWKLLPSVVDQINNSVATIGKVGGYYAIVSSCGGVAPAKTGTLGVSTKYFPPKTKVVKPIKKAAPKVIKKSIKKQPKP